MDAIQKQIKAIKDHVLPPEQHSQFDVLLGERGGYDINRKVKDPLHMYYRRNSITEQMYDAGVRLHTDFTIAGIYCIRAMNMAETRSSGQGFTIAQLEARERYRNAIAAVNGLVGKLMVNNVCCYGKALNETEALPYNSGNQKMARFIEAMADLQTHYKM